MGKLPTNWDPTLETPLADLDPANARKAQEKMESIPMASWISSGSIESLSARDLGIYLLRRLRLLGITRISDADLAVTFRVSRMHVHRIYHRTATIIGETHGDNHDTDDDVQCYRTDQAAAEDDGRSLP